MQHIVLTSRRKFFLASLLMVLIFTSHSLASDTSASSLIQLETDVWSVKDNELSALETRTTRLIQLYPYSSVAHYLLGQVYLQKFSANPFEMIYLRRAAELGQQAIDLNPDLDFGYVVSSQVLDIMGYTDNALKLIDPKKNTKIRESWRTLFLKAKFSLATRNYENALNLLRSAMQKRNAQSKVITPLALAVMDRQYLGKNLVNEVAGWYEEYGSQEAYLQLAIAHTDSGEYFEANKIYTSIIENPNSNLYIQALINKGLLTYNHIGDEKTSRSLFEKVLDVAVKKRVSNDKLNITRGYLAKIYLSQGEKEHSRRLLLENLRIPDGRASWLNQAYALYRSLQSFEDFSELLSELKKEIPGSAVVYALHGEILSEKLLRHKEAIESYSDAITLNPDKSELYNGLGLTYYRSKNMQLALEQFSRASEINPSDATARYNKACVLSIMGRKQEALSFLEEAISLDPRLLVTASGDKDFANIRHLSTFKTMIRPGSDLSQAVSFPY